MRKNRTDNKTVIRFDRLRRVHQTLRVTPAMEAAISDHVWSLEEIVKLLD
jgi:hypothetical protein